MRFLGFRKFFFVTALIAGFSAQLATPALAWRNDDDRGYGRDRHDRNWNGGRHDRHDRGHFRGHDRHHDRHHDRRTNFQVIIGQSYGPGWGPYYGHDYGYRPAYRPHRYPPPPVYYGRQDTNLLGGLFGGAVGGIAGSHIGDGNGRTAAIIGGTLIGALFGSNIGNSPYDHGHAANVFEATPSSQTMAWQNPDDGNGYQITPMRTFQANDGRYCREYQALATVGGRREQAYGTACRTPDGDWQIVN